MISVGIDVSKGKSTVCFMKPYGEKIHKPFEVKHTESDLKHLVDRINKLTEETRVVMESTGAYHYPVLTYLKDRGIFVAVINPLVMSKYINVAIRKGKTDKLDAIKIANFGFDHWYHLVDYSPTADVYDELKTLNRQYLSYMSMRIHTKQTLTNLLDRTMPGIKTLLRNRSDMPDQDKLCDFVKEYWHFDNITCKSQSEFINNYNTWVKSKGYRASTEKAKKIYALALDGIPTLSSNTPSTKMLVEEAVKVLHMIDTTLASILARMRALAKSLMEYDVVMAMPGVGEILGPRLIAEIGDVRRFHSAGALIAFAGLDAPPFQSGNFTATKRSISKRGSASLRKTGYEIMTCIKIHKPSEDGAVYQYMLKKETEGKHKKVAKIAALNKFLRIYYARVKESYVAA
ncbi:IS110 family transposase [Desulfosporosinus sp. BICA1-9]|uniref:IS110 family transposase n=1 Tax=Desulfosporosinus sp. BICA1-9 TaxID=1531958 RepID=UPI00054B28FB|nr:IS110 family transposase [Desulfosporosinus sp. BICA1-9]KJS45983.1 MAG: transposase [Peptococcaceae bacterium BRH_c23]KJS87301.1 MAG: transposase [Desulfosporosinus sp. BICA1-9]